MPKNPKQKQKLLYIMKFFMEKTDDDYGVTVADIIDYLEEYGITAERKVSTAISSVSEISVLISSRRRSARSRCSAWCRAIFLSRRSSS